MLKKKKIWIPSVSAVAIVAMVLLITLTPFQSDSTAKAETPDDLTKPIAEAAESAVTSAAAVVDEVANIEPVVQKTEPAVQAEETTPVQTPGSNSGGDSQKPVVTPPPAPTPTPTPPTPPADPNAGKKFVTTCTCGATFSDANEWRAHRNAFKEKWMNEEISKAEMDLHNGYSQAWQ
jgi:hypothetical protein